MSAVFDLVIVGMGSGGMVAAEFACSLGLRVAVVERSRVGGDCLWTGCVPSKALLAAAKAAHTMRTADRYGIAATEPSIDTAAVWDRVREVQRRIAATDDSPDRFRQLGIELLLGEPARLTGPNEVTVGSRVLRTRFVLLSTGSRPVDPAIDGLAETGYLTSESVFELERAPASIVVIGGGPIAVELAQAFNRLGTTTTVLQRGPSILPKDEPELVARLQRILVEEGVDIRVGVETRHVTGNTIATNAGDFTADAFLVAAGRSPNVEGLGLEDVGVEVTSRGIAVDKRMRTTAPWVYAAGDVAGRYLFTHSAAHEGVRAVRDMFFPGKGAVSDFVPWCTFTDPELAHAGLTSAEARDRHGHDRVRVWTAELAHSDRARAEDHDDGVVTVVTHKHRIVGAHALAPAAGELIHELALAAHKRMRIEELAGLIHVYPTFTTSSAQLAAEAAFEGAQRYRWLLRRSR